MLVPADEVLDEEPEYDEEADEEGLEYEEEEEEEEEERGRMGASYEVGGAGAP